MAVKVDYFVLNLADRGKYSTLFVHSQSYRTYTFIFGDSCYNQNIWYETLVSRTIILASIVSKHFVGLFDFHIYRLRDDIESIQYIELLLTLNRKHHGDEENNHNYFVYSASTICIRFVIKTWITLFTLIYNNLCLKWFKE